MPYHSNSNTNLVRLFFKGISWIPLNTVSYDMNFFLQKIELFYLTREIGGRILRTIMQ